MILQRTNSATLFVLVFRVLCYQESDATEVLHYYRRYIFLRLYLRIDQMRLAYKGHDNQVPHRQDFPKVL